jgi:hypothetical protein
MQSVLATLLVSHLNSSRLSPKRLLIHLRLNDLSTGGNCLGMILDQNLGEKNETNLGFAAWKLVFRHIRRI